MAVDAYYIGLQNVIFNVLTSKPNYPQTPSGQQTAISATDSYSETWITNGFLGAREITHPITGQKNYITRGYITKTVPEDVYKISAEERSKRKIAPIEQFIYPSGSTWIIPLITNVQL